MSKGKGGRPTDYTPELADTICERVIMRPLHKVCDDADMPSESTVYAWLAKHAEFSEKYARARAIRAFRRAEQVDQVREDMRSGVIDAQVARVEIDAIKWQTGKENPRVFGERLALAGDEQTPLMKASDDQIDARIRELLGKGG